MNPISDLPARREALDIRRSFIVQAPAGSGKTELLTQRILGLLAAAENPEEIVAITFTRKAAAEMRNRLLEKLAAADAVQQGFATVPDSEHDLVTYRLACAALARDADKGWNLLGHPSRLRIQTMDSLCKSLVALMPVLAQLGSGIRPADDARRHYLEAARETLAALESPDAATEDVAALGEVLGHLDNDLGKLQDLIARMLGRRDQWLPHLLELQGEELAVRAWLEDLLAEQSRSHLALTRQLLPPGFLTTLAPLARAAAQRLRADSQTDGFTSLADWPEGTLTGEPSELPIWRAIADLCLTTGDTLRKTVNKTTGFPTDAKADKVAFLALLGDLNTEIESALAALRRLPAPIYTDEQWQVLRALIRVLRQAAARLWLQFLAAGEVDFAEIQSRALQALGTEAAPTDLALALDYRIHHLLVDEFQDTSGTQWELLRRLTAGWQAGDGRSLFLVGDPMQSIYLFRQAEVGLFLEACQHGLGDVALEPLTLSANFRSCSGIVEWVNEAFTRIFPPRADALRGAVPVSLAEAVKPAGEGPAVQVHAFVQGLAYDAKSQAPIPQSLPLQRGGREGDGGAVHSATENPIPTPALPLKGRESTVDAPTAEARRVLALIRDALAAGENVAVLVRSRSHLKHIAPALLEAGIAFQAVDIDALAERQTIADLVSLTRAMLLPADRVHWLAVLRAPWCGLTLSDLHALCGDDRETGLARLLADDERLARLSPDGAARAKRCRDILLPLLNQHGRLALRDRVERAWLQLGGEALLADPAEREDVAAYFDLVEEMDGPEGFEPDDLAQKLADLFAAPQVGEAAQVQLMTIHKSKGLEFDNVILPGLGRKPRGADKELLHWMATPAPDGGQGLLIAPVHATGGDKDALYQYIGRLRDDKEAFESQRLLYVAATRAKKRLHLLGVAISSEKEGVKPAARSLLALLWDQVQAEFDALPAPSAQEETPASQPPALPLKRVPAGWRPVPPSPVDFLTARTANPMPQEAATVHLEAAATGIATHRILQQMAEDALAGWDAARISSLRPFLRRLVERQGVVGDAASRATSQTEAALLRCLAAPDGRWALGTHPVSRNEWELAEETVDGLKLHIIDRYFETATGERWIVDWKTDMPPEDGQEAWLVERKEAHRPQLERYARLLQAMTPGPVHLALYFTALPRLVRLEGS